MMKPVPILPPIGARREAFNRVFTAGKAAHGDGIGLVYVDATPRAVFQKSGDAARYCVAITEDDFKTLTTP